MWSPSDEKNWSLCRISTLSLNEMNVKLKNTGHGVIPDYEVKSSITDMLQEKDKEMEFALKLIQERHGN